MIRFQRGAKNILERYQPIIFCEVLEGRGSEKDLNEIMGSLGYDFYLLTPDGMIKKEVIEGHPQWLNYLFATPHHNIAVR